MVKFGIVLIVIQTENGFNNPTKLIIIIRIKKVKSSLKIINIVEVQVPLQQPL